MTRGEWGRRVRVMKQPPLRDGAGACSERYEAAPTQFHEAK